MEKTIWTDSVRNDEVLHGVKEERNILQTIKIRKTNCIPKHVIEGNIGGRIEVMGRRRRRRKQLHSKLK
jgi:hypothetical protein